MLYRYPVWFRVIVERCLAHMDISSVRKFCAELKWTNSEVFWTKDFASALTARISRRKIQDSTADAVDILSTLVGCKNSRLRGCRAAWINMAKYAQNWDCVYAGDEFDRYVIRGCRGAECGDYTVTALPRLLELFELQ